MSVVVTGASGYVGQHVCVGLAEREISVAALGRAEQPGLFTCRRTGVTGSLESFMDGADGIIHLAGRLVDNPAASVEDYFEANVAFTDRVTHAAVEEGVPIIVHASSRLVYPSTLTAPARETLDVAPDTAYGLSKAWAEDVVRVRTAGTGTSALSLRIGQVTGGDHPGIGVIRSLVRQAIQRGTISVNGRGLAVRDIVHVQDVADVLIRATDYRGDWKAMNVGGVEPVTITQIAHMVAKLAGISEDNITHVETVTEDLSSYALSPERAYAVLDWHASIPLTDIIAEVLATREEETA